jgi:hypothetical protein
MEMILLLLHLAERQRKDGELLFETRRTRRQRGGEENWVFCLAEMKEGLGRG